MAPVRSKTRQVKKPAFNMLEYLSSKTSGPVAPALARPQREESEALGWPRPADLTRSQPVSLQREVKLSVIADEPFWSVNSQFRILVQRESFRVAVLKLSAIRRAADDRER
jgi:hypothetical protein